MLQLIFLNVERRPADEPFVKSKLMKPANDVREVLDLIATTKFGRSILGAFLPDYRSRRISFEAYPADIVAKLAQCRDPGTPAGAAFVTDGETGTIYYDAHSELAVLAIFFVHEIAHSVDGSIWNAADTQETQEQRRRRVIRSEAIAFECQYRFLAELTRLHPSLMGALAEKYPNGNTLYRRLSIAEIGTLYEPLAS